MISKSKIGGNGQVLRKVLAVLKEEKVWSTGKTKNEVGSVQTQDKVEAEFNKG